MYSKFISYWKKTANTIIFVVDVYKCKGHVLWNFHEAFLLRINLLDIQEQSSVCYRHVVYKRSA